MKFYWIIVPFLLLLACSARKKEFKSPAHYDLNHPKVYKMEKDLVEISGHAFYHGNNDTIYAEQDEAGAVYSLVLGSKYQHKAVFKDKGDFEDIAILGETVFMLRSDGSLFSFPFSETRKDQISDAQEFHQVVPKGEYEGLYADSTQNLLYILCKNCSKDVGKNKVSGYIFYVNGEGKPKKVDEFQFKVDTIATVFNKKKIDLRASAFAWNPKSKEWFVVSSVRKVMVILDKNWKLKTFYHLDPSLYVQPEGIAFDKDNNLFLSSEGGGLGAGKVYRIDYHE